MLQELICFFGFGRSDRQNDSSRRVVVGSIGKNYEFSTDSPAKNGFGQPDGWLLCLDMLDVESTVASSYSKYNFDFGGLAKSSVC